jgi:hypothetical protein
MKLKKKISKRIRKTPINPGKGAKPYKPNRANIIT